MNVLNILKEQNIEILEEAINNKIEISQLDIQNFINTTEEVNAEFAQYLINKNFHIQKTSISEYPMEKAMTLYEAGDYPYDIEEMEYVGDGMWVHNSECWW